jgi:hypothetical protein
MAIDKATAEKIANAKMCLESLKNTLFNYKHAVTYSTQKLGEQTFLAMGLAIEALTTPQPSPSDRGDDKANYNEMLESFVEIAKQRTIERQWLRAIIEALKGDTSKAELMAMACEALDGKTLESNPKAASNTDGGEG